MQAQNAATASRHWLMFGMRWLGVVFLAALVLMLQDSAPSTGTVTLTAAVVVSVSVNALLAIIILIPALSGATPIAAFFGDLIIVGIFCAVSTDPIVVFSAVSLGIISAIQHSAVIFSVIHIIGVIGAGFITYTAAINGSDASRTNSMAEVLPLLLGMAAAAVIVAYLVERQTTAINKELDEAGRQRTAQLDDMRVRIRAMYDIAYTMGSTLKYDKVLETALEAGRVGLRLSGAGTDAELIAAVMLFHADDNALHVSSGRRLTRSDTQMIIPGKEGIVGQALRETVPVFAASAKNDPELGYFVAFQYCRSLVVVPLRAIYDNFGVLIYGSERANAFTDEHAELLTSIGVQATIALQNAVLYQDLTEEKERIIEVEDDARRKLASDLHDGPTQNISAMVMRVSYISKLLEKRPMDVAEELRKLEDLARRTSKEIRQVLFTWRPLVLESHGLPAALKGLAEKVEETHGQRVQVRVSGDAPYVLDKKQQVVVFHIVEEAINNARKHANASLITVSIYRQEDAVLLQVMDNGQGFDANANANKDGRNSLGMTNMRERAELIDGTFHVDSSPGKGTVITVVVPVKTGEAAPESASSSGIRARRPRKSMTKLALAAAARAEKVSIRDTNQ